MNIQQSTQQYERWLGTYIDVVPNDIRHKHELMADGVFPFFRATFYRWMQLWPEACPDLRHVHDVLAVGDLHVENFGTWRDREGRLAWGVNDFDEAFPLPWTIDLVRLATSALLAIRSDHLSLGRREACDAILDGYTQGIKSKGRPFVLAEDHGWLRQIANGKLRDPAVFWNKLDSLSTWRRPVPDDARNALRDFCPETNLESRIIHRVAGLGSLGRHRFVALSDWHGGRIAREAKALAPSACYFASNKAGSTRTFYQDIVDRALRVPDPCLGVRGRWIVRRLAPDCARVELVDLPARHDESVLLYSMGYETANVHLGTKNARSIISRDLATLVPRWLQAAAKRMTELVTEDWKQWRYFATR
jgi:hypothetical protein